MRTNLGLPLEIIGNLDFSTSECFTSTVIKADKLANGLTRYVPHSVQASCSSKLPLLPPWMISKASRVPSGHEHKEFVSSTTSLLIIDYFACLLHIMSKQIVSQAVVYLFDFSGQKQLRTPELI